MSLSITSKDYVEYLKTVADRIKADKDYITKLDADTGDGDHWANMNVGFESLVAKADELSAMPIDQMFKTIGMTMMSKIGGSSGILYGGGYIAASKAVAGSAEIDLKQLCLSLDAMCSDMMLRGKAEPGMKTMIDAIYPAVEVFKQGLDEGKDASEICARIKHAAKSGAQSTIDMPAVKGRATYQLNKGVGHLDPGAVTMSYQIECLSDKILELAQGE